MTSSSSSRTAVVTGASSGIGAATARALAADGYRVVCAARRHDRVRALAAEIGGVAVACDITVDDDVAALVEEVGDQLTLLVNNAGGALGQETLAEADLDAWQRMYETNVLGTARVTKALLPALEAGEGTVVFLTSTAAESAYEGGGGYNAAKAGEAMLVHALRLELNGEPIRVTEGAPGMVHTPEFTLNRLGGDRASAERVYDGVESPLVASDVADVIAYALNAPGHVNLDLVTMRPVAQSAQHLLARGELRPRD